MTKDEKRFGFMREVPKELRQKSLRLKLLEKLRCVTPKTSIIKCIGSDLVLESLNAGIRGTLFIGFSFHSKGSFIYGHGGHYGAVGFDYCGSWEDSPGHIKEIVQYTSQVTQEEYNNYIHIIKDNAHLDMVPSIMLPLDRFRKNYLQCEFSNLDQFNKLINWHVDYIPKFIERHSKNPIFSFDA